MQQESITTTTAGNLCNVDLDNGWENKRGVFHIAFRIVGDDPGSLKEQNEKHEEYQIMAKPMRSVHKTWVDLSVDEIFHKFISGLLEILQNKLSKREVIGHNYMDSYYTCGQSHDPRNPKWKPFQHLEQYCERTKFDFLTVKDIIEDRIGRKFKCECQLLRDDRSRRRFELKQIYGVDFSGMPGQGDFDIV